MRLREIEKKVKKLKELSGRAVCYSMDVWRYNSGAHSVDYKVYIESTWEHEMIMIDEDTPEEAFEKAFNHFKK